jgi:hypothetical protein
MKQIFDAGRKLRDAEGKQTKRRKSVKRQRRS